MNSAEQSGRTFVFLVTWSDHNRELSEGLGSGEESGEETEEKVDMDREEFRQLLAEAGSGAEVPVGERIEEIMDEVKDRGHVLMIDDYLAHGSTLTQIDRLFGEAASKRGAVAPETVFFAFFGPQNLMKGAASGDLSYVSSVFVGTTSRDSLFFSGFDHCARSDSFFPDDWELDAFRKKKEAQLGVRKEVGKKYSQKVDHVNQLKMHELRRSLRYEAERTLDWLESRKRKEEGDQA